MTFLRLLWTVLGLCQSWRRRMMARLKLQQATEKIQRVTCKPCRGYISPPARANLSDLPSSHICSSRHLLELHLGKTWQREAESHFSLPSCQAGRKRQRELTHYVLVVGSCGAWTMRLCLHSWPSQCRDSEWNMEGGKSLPGSANWNVSLWQIGYLDVAWWIVQTGKVTFSPFSSWQRQDYWRTFY